MTADRLAAIVIFVVAVLYMRESTAFRGVTVADVVGPSAYPLLIGGLTAALAVVQFIRGSSPGVAGPFWKRHGRALLLAAALFAYTRALEPLGFLVSTFVYLTLSHLWLGERSRLRAIAVGLGLTLGLWLLFDRTLDLRLPVGILGIPR
ncbi:MAG TPA: tripartite tricarboxylate transporter TctB family protein [bacterium]|nr:tripartite tricarboxylate transporter TctB family protein [bacterium]